MSAEFDFSVHEYQSNDAAAGDFLDIRVTAACRGFAGQTHFWVSRRDLDSFLADLASVRGGERDFAQLLGGWEDAEERLRLRIAPAGALGSFSARVRIANTGPRTDQWHRVEMEFVVAPDALSAFLTGLQRLVDERGIGGTKLIGDPEAIA